MRIQTSSSSSSSSSKQKQKQKQKQRKLNTYSSNSNSRLSRRRHHQRTESTTTITTTTTTKTIVLLFWTASLSVLGWGIYVVHSQQQQQQQQQQHAQAVLPEAMDRWLRDVAAAATAAVAKTAATTTTTTTTETPTPTPTSNASNTNTNSTQQQQQQQHPQHTTTSATTTSTAHNNNNINIINNNNNNNNTKPYTVRDDALVAWRETRKHRFNTWFVNGNGTDKLRRNADQEGPILDFVIVGYPKCGTTALMSNLASVTTMPPETDIPAPADNTVYYAYHNWEKKYQNRNPQQKKKLLKGTKCPFIVDSPEYTEAYGTKLPRTKVIVGIRHPVLWFQSFHNMQTFNHRAFPNYNKTTPQQFFSKQIIQVCTPNDRAAQRRRIRNRRYHEHKCDSFACSKVMVKACVARARFHLSLAALKKTALTTDERQLLMSEIVQSYQRRRKQQQQQQQQQQQRKRGDNSNDNHHNSTSATHNKNNNDDNDNDNDNDVHFPIPDYSKGMSDNPVFLFESSQPRNEPFWQELSKFLVINRTDLPMESATTGYTMSGLGLNSKRKTEMLFRERETKHNPHAVFDICDPIHDFLRKELLPISYTLREWLVRYWLPLANDPNRHDVVVPNPNEFERLINGFAIDPCNGSHHNHLVRNATDGEYY